jgi:hypothetical protein
MAAQQDKSFMGMPVSTPVSRAAVCSASAAPDQQFAKLHLNGINPARLRQAMTCRDGIAIDEKAWI